MKSISFVSLCDLRGFVVTAFCSEVSIRIKSGIDCAGGLCTCSPQLQPPGESQPRKRAAPGQTQRVLCRNASSPRRRADARPPLARRIPASVHAGELGNRSPRLQPPGGLIPRRSLRPRLPVRIDRCALPNERANMLSDWKPLGSWFSVLGSQFLVLSSQPSTFPDTPASPKVAISSRILQAAWQSDMPSAAPVPSPRRMPRSKSGVRSR